MEDPLFYRRFLRPLLFMMDPEKAHERAMGFLEGWGSKPAIQQRIGKHYSLADPRLEKELFGVRFPNPVGIAAGLDKSARAYEGLGAFGPGFVEVGTITPLPQKGNPRPRLFRLPEDRALLNRMGFNNDGVEAIAERLRERSGKLRIGANIGKNKDTPNEEAEKDLEACIRKLQPYVDYLVVNVSSPNTPGLRALQGKEALHRLLSKCKETVEERPERKPLLLKIAPDLSRQELDELIEVVNASGIDGLIASNTSIVREGLRTGPDRLQRYGEGGISGEPVKARASEMIRYLKEGTGGKLPLIGVGGIMSETDALERLDAGADLLQLYTGMIYEGPALVKRILRAILDRQE